MEKDLGITEVRGAKANISDLVVYGDGDTFALLCKASSKDQGWMKSTKVCNSNSGCIVQVTTQQKNPDGSYSVAEALTYVPDININTESEPRKLISIAKDDAVCSSNSSDSFYRQQSYLSSLIEVASRTDHKLHDEIDDAVKKLKELTYQG